MGKEKLMEQDEFPIEQIPDDLREGDTIIGKDGKEYGFVVIDKVADNHPLFEGQ